MGAAITIGAASRCRCAAGLCPCLFRGTGFDQKKTLVVHAIVFLSHPLDHSVSQINRITRHIVPPGEPYARVCSPQSFASHAALTRQALLSNIEQSRKNYCQAPQAGTPDHDHLKDASAVIARGQSGDKRHPQIGPLLYRSLYFHQK
jgi:hypothetical protein